MNREEARVLQATILESPCVQFPTTLHYDGQTGDWRVVVLLSGEDSGESVSLRNDQEWEFLRHRVLATVAAAPPPPHPAVVQALETLLSEMHRLLRPLGGSHKITEAIAALKTLDGVK